jgi:hypothetical protein
MQVVRGMDIGKEYFQRKLLDACCAVIEIQYDSKELSITLSDKCSADIKFLWSDKEARAEESKINELIKMTYCSTKVCISIIPNKPYTESELASMAAAISSLTSDRLHSFESALRLEVHQMAIEQIRRAAS